MSSDSVRYVTPSEIAERFACKPETVVGWIKSGELLAIDIARHGSMKPRYRVSPEALATFELVRSVVPRAPVVRKPTLDIEVKKFV